MEKKKSGHVCAVKNCKNKRYVSSESFFRFPTEKTRATLWALASGRDDLLENIENVNRSYRLCGAHFENKMFCNKNRNRLLPTAVPTIFPSLEGQSQYVPNEHNYCAFVAESSVSAIPEVNVSETDALLPLEINIPEPLSTIGEELISPSSSTQTPSMLSVCSPLKDRMRRKIKSQAREIKQLQERNEELEKELGDMKNNILNAITLEDHKILSQKFCPSQEMANFINVQLSPIQKHLKKGRRYSFQFKRECVALYFTSPKLYKQNLMKKFCLPSPTTLLKLLGNLKINPGLNNVEYFSMLKMKVANFTSENKFCTLCIDEMAFKPNLFYNIGVDKVIGFKDNVEQRIFKPAMTATVLLVRGIYSKWSQLLCLYFFNSSCCGYILKEIVHNAIIKLKEIGVTICTLISDMESNNLQLAESIGITPDHPFFYVEDLKVTYMFDTPHLLKALRNNFIRYKFVHNDKEMLWQHVVQLRAQYKQHPTKVAPRLSDVHIYPNNFEKMKVKYAAQIFSATVAAGIMYVRFGVLPASAAATAEFIDKLFDIMNSSSTAVSKQHNKAFKALDYQIIFFKRM